MRQMFVFNGQTLYIQGLDIDVELDCTKHVLLSLETVISRSFMSKFHFETVFIYCIVVSSNAR